MDWVQLIPGCIHDSPYTGAITVHIGTAWLTCVITLLVSNEENVDDLVLGHDWWSHLEELCTAMNMCIPLGLV